MISQASNLSNPGNLGNVTLEELREQLGNPRHCLVQVSLGGKGQPHEVLGEAAPVYWCHNPRDPDNRERNWAKLDPILLERLGYTKAWVGLPVRFSLLAAERLVAQLKMMGWSKARVVPLED